MKGGKGGESLDGRGAERFGVLGPVVDGSGAGRRHDTNVTTHTRKTRASIIIIIIIRIVVMVIMVVAIS